MISFPHAKINLGLSIISKRSDGFHNLETIFYPLPFYDILEIVPDKGILDDEPTNKMRHVSTGLKSTGLHISGSPDKNLVLSAYALLKANYPAIGPLIVHLHKMIPMGAGLGGGSSDAAAMLQLVNGYFDLQISPDELSAFASTLGSDCPFFLQSDPCYATGRGEVLQPVSVDLSRFSFLLVHPDIRVETAWAFTKVNPCSKGADLRKIIAEPITNWKDSLVNGFEAPVFAAYPNLGKVKDQLYAAGAMYASMTGSGSTIYGIFEKGKLPEIEVENAKFTFIP